jgi:hypothetical protein
VGCPQRVRSLRESNPASVGEGAGGR